MFDIQQWQIRFFAARVNTLKASGHGKIQKVDNFIISGNVFEEIFNSHRSSEKR